MKSIFVSIIFFLSTLGAKSLDNLLHTYNNLHDLSHKTKEEDAGFLIIYSREDLEHMQIFTLKELIEKIPFLRYKENRFGLTDPSYIGVAPPLHNILQIYINDRSLVSGYSQNSIKLYGDISLDFIDHVEIYLGVPSLTFGIESGAFVIKLYTKDPSRENVTIFKGAYGSKGSQTYTMSDAKELKHYKYHLYANFSKFQRSTLHFKNNSFYKDNENVHTYFEFFDQDQRLELEAILMNKNAFLGTSSTFQSQNPTLDSKLLYGGWYYNKNGWRSFINVTHTQSDINDQSQYPLQYIALPSPPYILPYSSLHLVLNDTIANFHLSKTFINKDSQTLLGMQYRYKYFEPKEAQIDTIQSPFSKDYNTQQIISTFFEYNSLPSLQNRITFSLKYDQFHNNGDIQNYYTLSARIGNIYKKGSFINKTFFIYKEIPTSIESLYNNRYLYLQTNTLKKLHSGAVATRFLFHKDTQRFALLFSKTWIAKPLQYAYNNHSLQIINSPHTVSYDGIDFEWSRSFESGSLRLDLWKLFSHYKNRTKEAHAAILQLFYHLDRWTLYNDLIYKNYYNNEGVNANFTAQLQLSAKKMFYIKATNIFNSAIKESYISFDPLQGLEKTEKVTLFDRRVWIGFEWSF